MKLGETMWAVVRSNGEILIASCKHKEDAESFLFAASRFQGIPELYFRVVPVKLVEVQPADAGEGE